MRREGTYEELVSPARAGTAVERKGVADTGKAKSWRRETAGPVACDKGVTRHMSCWGSLRLHLEMET